MTTHLYFGLLFLIIGAAVLWLAERLHYFRLKNLPDEKISLRFPIIWLIGYALLFFFIAPLSIRLLGKTLNEILSFSLPHLFTVSHLIVQSLVISYLLIFSFSQEKKSLRGLWIHEKRMRLSCLLEDFGLGMLTYLIAIPAVIAVSQLSDYLTFIITGEERIDQIAIVFLKAVKDSPLLLGMALFSILILAPFIEEFVFRGILQTYLKGKMGFKGALITSSAIFALVHFAPQQGASNFPLFISLFSFALFLGFLYERQRSLIAPIALHMTFNSISVIRIVLFSN